MSVAEKFTFDLDLAKAPPRNKVMAEDAFEFALAAARQEGYDLGFREGKDAVEARAAATLAQSAEAIAAQATGMLASLDDHQKHTLEDAVALAASVGRKLAAHLIAQQPMTELSALLADAMATLERAPHLVVRCHPDLCEKVKALAEERAALSGFAGRLVVMGDPEIGLGDGRLEWADGGLVRDLDAIAHEIDARIAAYIAARTRKEDA